MDHATDTAAAADAAAASKDGWWIQNGEEKVIDDDDDAAAPAPAACSGGLFTCAAARVWISCKKYWDIMKLNARGHSWDNDSRESLSLQIVRLLIV